MPSLENILIFYSRSITREVQIISCLQLFSGSPFQESLPIILAAKTVVILDQKFPGMLIIQNSAIFVGQIMIGLSGDTIAEQIVLKTDGMRDKISLRYPGIKITIEGKHHIFFKKIGIDLFHIGEWIGV